MFHDGLRDKDMETDSKIPSGLNGKKQKFIDANTPLIYKQLLFGLSSSISTSLR